MPGESSSRRGCAPAVAAHADGATPRTRWVFPVRLDGRNGPSRAVDHDQIVRLLRCDLQRGHRRLAFRHCLMLERAVGDVPSDLARLCAVLRERLPAQLQARIAEDVERWWSSVIQRAA